MSMSFFSWLLGSPGAVKLNGHLARNDRLAATDVLPLKEDTKEHRHTRREQLYSVIRDAMMCSGVLSSRYRFKVLSLDPRGNTFLVMMDLSQQENTQNQIPHDLEKKVMLQAMTRFDIAVSSVYWRFGVAAFETPPHAEFQKTVEFGDPADENSGAFHVYKTIELDELAAFRNARLSDAGKGSPVLTSSAKKTKPATLKKSRQVDFEDTEIMNDIPSPRLRASQYGELN